jgi:DNA-binding NarL/FixJ family response regulator
MGKVKEKYSYCHNCKHKLLVQEREKERNAKRKQERQEILRIVNFCGNEVNFYYKKHQNIFDKWANGKSTYQLSKELNCSHQNISIIISNLKSLLNLYNLQSI